MRFNWRRHLVVTAFAAGSMLPFVGCSSQQQQATDEVAAEGQGQGQEGDGQGDGEEAVAQGQGGGEETAAAEQGAGNPSAEPVSGGENLAGNGAVVESDPASNGDLKEIISEMNGSQNAQAVAETTPAEAVPAEAVPAEVAPSNAGTAAEATAAAAQAAPSSNSASVAGIPEMGSKMAYVVEAGDTLAKIATKVYGDQKRWKDIAGLSGMDNPNHIYPGDLVYYTLDEQSQNFAQSYETLKRSQETVRAGDTLAAISKRVYGKSNLWKHIWRQNEQIDNPDKLTAGMTVYYIEKSSIKTAQTKIKSTHTTAFKKSAKATNLMTYGKTKATKKAIAVIAASV